MGPAQTQIISPEKVIPPSQKKRIIRRPHPQINAKKGVNCQSPKKIQAKKNIWYRPRQIQNI